MCVDKVGVVTSQILNHFPLQHGKVKLATEFPTETIPQNIGHMPPVRYNQIARCIMTRIQTQFDTNKDV